MTGCLDHNNGGARAKGFVVSGAWAGLMRLEPSGFRKVGARFFKCRVCSDRCFWGLTVLEYAPTKLS